MGRIQIRPPRKEAPISINDTWQNVLQPALHEIYRLESGGQVSKKLSFKVLYDSVYRLVTQGHGRVLLRKFSETTHAYLETLPPLTPSPQKKRRSEEPVSNGLEGETSSLDTKEEEQVLGKVSKHWYDFQVSLQLIGDIFMYLDRSYCGESGTPTTDQIGRQLFRDDVLKNSLDPIFNLLLKQINRERHGSAVNSQMLKSVTGMLKLLTEDSGENSSSIFDSRFRSHLIADAIKVYSDHMEEMSSLPAFTKLRKCDEWLKKESQLGVFYLPEETQAELVSALEIEVIDKALPSMLKDPGSGVTLWVAEDNLSALKFASELETRGPSRTLVAEVSNELLLNQRAINSAKTEPIPWVESTIQLREKYVRIAEAVGQNAWTSTLSGAHQHEISECSGASNLLALYLDEHLKKSADIPNENVEPALDKALILYNCIGDRDEFSLIFQRLLARRLLNNSSRNREYEFSWLQRLKEENLNSDSINFERMIMNIDESKLLFHGSTSIAPGIIPTNVNVLSMHLWPKSMQPQAQTQYPLVLPGPIAEAKSKFEDFYSSVKRDRVLKWNYSLTNTDIKVRVGEKTYHVSAPLVCASILTLFENDEVYTTTEISLRTQIPMGNELERHLKSLYLAPGSELLRKSPPGKDVNPGDEFSFNTGFDSAKQRIKIKKISAAKPATGTVNQEDVSILAQERSQKAEAAIVRIMKAKNTLSHALLVQQAIGLLQPHFKAPQILIKRAIQDLLAKGYIEREQDDTESYRYIA